MRSITFSFALIFSALISFTACSNEPNPKQEPPTITTETSTEQQPEATTTALKEEETQPQPATEPTATPKPSTEKTSTKTSPKAEVTESKVENTEPEAKASEPKNEPTKVETPVVETSKETPTPPKPVKTKPDHSAWNKLLQAHVSSSGKVNYKGFKGQKSELEAYLKDLENFPPQDSWSRAEQMAYWINAYNAFTVKLIVDNYPVASITNLHGGKPWDVKWIKLGGQTYTLNNIENDILRPKYKDARIHFAVNCAAKSCPPIHNRAFTASNLESTLNSQAKKFINNSSFNTISANSIEVSKIFEWYAVDFGDLPNYLNKYANTKINSGAEIKFKAYDWALNQ